MPLVVPGLQSKDGNDQTSKWMNELMGKKIGDQSNETDLPEKHRVIEQGDMTTQDHVPERLNIHVGSDGTVQKVNHG
ncbi:hypothetical protein AMS68_007902 [Peltaster fructicola]|uniref:Uncharacterized protein n=1 Tax=Peltaster fructicola TaxID=286661 RepID=A0A6H0Y657_9PEZI|nr:hypothetical protein AMS68_007902 [Peltaster fructicola]